VRNTKRLERNTLPLMFGRDELLANAARRYTDYLRAVLADSTIFPLELRIGKSRRAESYAERASELAKFRGVAAEISLTVEWRSVSDPRFGTHERPVRGYFANEADFVRALNKETELRNFRNDVKLIRSRFSSLEPWLLLNVQMIVEFHGVWRELLNVLKWFAENPRSGLYLRQVPVEGVDTKFYERYQSVLDRMLLFLHPDTVDSTNARFEARHGLRWEQPLVRVRFLDKHLQTKQGFLIDDFAVPTPIFRSLPLGSVTVVITENLRNFLALPGLDNAVAILGSGDAAALLSSADWLFASKIVYWGDLDARGFAILARLRQNYPHVESLLMDTKTLNNHRHLAVKFPQVYAETLSLTAPEVAAMQLVCSEGLRLEQERIPYSEVLRALEGAVGGLALPDIQR
jgi:hypothetical protein